MPNLFAEYAGSPDRYDELRGAEGRPRAHWARFHETLGALSPGALRTRLEVVAREIRDSGITYNVYADPQGFDRPWDLDCLPLILPAAEWAVIEAGIAQRATLLNALLADIYGDASLQRRALLPAAILKGHSGYLRPACGMQVPGGVYLHHYAADLARSPDGGWWVLADRTQAPSGAAYALENRLMVARMFPELFRDLSVQRLAGYFAALRDALRHYAPRDDGAALIVVLTPGPYNETYFEHAFLSRYLGFPLVEGGDLVVRRDCVWLKTIEGLRRVHAIVRRQDDAFCDPLELRADSALGVPGLTGGARRGNVLIANALGAGVLESGALLGYLPRLCRELLGAELALPSVATWWCGEPAACHDALEKVERLVFKPANPAEGFEPVFGQDLRGPALTEFKAAVTAAPHRYIAQELVRMSQAPSFAQGPRVGVRGVGLRVFAVATPTGYQVMPGGLTRVSTQDDPRVISNQRGGSSKDTWIIGGTERANTVTLLSDARPRAVGIVSSRVVEHLFWFGRYAERCDDTARLLRVALNSLVQDAEQASENLATLARRVGMKVSTAYSTRQWCEMATLEQDPAGLPAQLSQLARVAFGLRERMSLDNWRIVNRLLQDPSVGRNVSVAETLEWLDRAVAALMTIAGFTLDGMTRDLGWRFLSIGRRLERLAFLCNALDVALDEARPGNLAWLLELCDSIVTFRARYMTRTDWPAVLELLVFDTTNPRALSFQVEGIHDYLQKLAAAAAYPDAARFTSLVAALRALAPVVEGPAQPALRNLVRELRGAAYDLSERLSAQYFSHLNIARQATRAS